MTDEPIRDVISGIPGDVPFHHKIVVRPVSIPESWWGEPAVAMVNGQIAGRSLGTCPHEPMCDMYQCRGPGTPGRPVGGAP